MSTGGGWQDQAGGMIPGVKLLTSAPGAWQEISVRGLVIPARRWRRFRTGSA
jgi:fucokinase